MIFRGKAMEYLQIDEIHTGVEYVLLEKMEEPLTFLWFTEDRNEIIIDNQFHTFDKNIVLCLTEFHKLKFESLHNTRLLRFNRAFYCILENDAEVGCNGLLFFGTAGFPNFEISKEQLIYFETLWKMFQLEIGNNDSLQLEILQSLLKRFIKSSTNILKNQTELILVEKHELDIIREFNILVDFHFRTKYTLPDYAALMHKSSKTISNIFSKFSSKTPLQYINERRLLEAKRLLKYTPKTIKEIAIELDFNDVQSFSRFFKNQLNLSPTEYKTSDLGRIDNK